jgi:hypothetical protein
MTRAREHELEHVTDEDIRIELQRRVEEVPAPEFVDAHDRTIPLEAT